VTAVVVLKEGATITRAEVHSHARELLAGYKRPKYLVFAETLPKNPSGKILKKDLRAQYTGLAEAAVPEAGGKPQ